MINWVRRIFAIFARYEWASVAEPRGSSHVRAKRSREGVPAFCTIPIIHSVTIHIRNVLNATNEWASGVCRTVQVVQSIFLPFPLSVYPWCEFTSPFLYPSLLSQTRISTIPSSHATGRDPLRHTFDPLIEGSSWSKRLSLRGYG